MQSLNRMRRFALIALAVSMLPALIWAQGVQPRKKLLFLTHAGLYKHSSLEPAEAAVTEYGKTGGFDVTALQGFKQDSRTSSAVAQCAPGVRRGARRLLPALDRPDRSDREGQGRCVKGRGSESPRHEDARIELAGRLHILMPFSRDRVHVLLSLDTDKTDLSDLPNVAKGDYPQSWTRNFGKGRTFYTTLGHRDDIWAHDAVFRAHVTGGIRWALGLED